MDATSEGVTRRQFLVGRIGRSDAAQQLPGERHCISSALVTVLPNREDEVARMLAAMEGVEIRLREGGKMVVLLEGPGSGAVGALLVQIAVMEGVISANMVFEHEEQATEGA